MFHSSVWLVEYWHFTKVTFVTLVNWRCLWTFRSALARWTQLRQLRVLLTSMAESFKVMVWLVLLVLIFIYVYGLVLTESIWDSCPNDQTPLVCRKFGDLLSSQMTLYQIIYSGLLWGELWDELQEMAWYVRIVFLSYVVFALMVFLESMLVQFSTCSFCIFLSILFLLTRNEGVSLRKPCCGWVVLHWNSPKYSISNIPHTRPPIWGTVPCATTFPVRCWFRSAKSSFYGVPGWWTPSPASFAACKAQSARGNEMFWSTTKSITTSV